MADKIEWCLCGDKPRIETDKTTGATFIQCLGCGIMYGGDNRDEAKTMWNGAIKALKTLRGITDA